MSENPNNQIDPQELEDFRRIQEKRKAKGKRDRLKQQFSITSLMDIMTILLVFMLKNYASNPMNINPSEDLQLVKSLETEELHTRLTPLAITQNHILVDDKAVVQVKKGRVAASTKREGEDGYFITPLFDSLQETVKHQKKLAQYNPSVKFTGKLLVIGDESVPYRLLTEVLYTAGQAEFNQFEFAVIRM